MLKIQLLGGLIINFNGLRDASIPHHSFREFKMGSINNVMSHKRAARSYTPSLLHYLFT